MARICNLLGSARAFSIPEILLADSLAMAGSAFVGQHASTWLERVKNWLIVNLLSINVYL